MLIFCLTLLVLLPSCSDQNIPEDFSQEESAFRDETSDTMKSPAPLNQQEIKLDPERVLPGNPENYHVGLLTGILSSIMSLRAPILMCILMIPKPAKQEKSVLLITIPLIQGRCVL